MSEKAHRYLLLSIISTLIVLSPVIVGLTYYTIKTTRETIQSQFIFGDEEQAFWKFNLVDKRLDEAATLKKIGLTSLSQRQVKLAQEYQNQAETHLNKLINVIDVNYLLELRDKNQKRLAR